MYVYPLAAEPCLHPNLSYVHGVRGCVNSIPGGRRNPFPGGMQKPNPRGMREYHPRGCLGTPGICLIHAQDQKSCLATRDTQHRSRPNLRRRDPNGRILPASSDASDKAASKKRCSPRKRNVTIIRERNVTIIRKHNNHTNLRGFEITQVRLGTS